MNKKPLVLFEHPVAPEVRQKIMHELAAIESRDDVRILFACESGSRGWGFASPDSDYDVRFIYVHRLAWYLTVAPGRDVIELPISDELDISGWELRKALGLLRRSNPTLLEWLDSPIVYRQEERTMACFRQLAERHFSQLSGGRHYQAMAKKNFRGYLQGESVRLKKYLYVLRPLLALQWIERGLGTPPMRFADLVQGLVDEIELLDEINRLLAAKMLAGEAEYSPRWERIHAFIEAELAREPNLAAKLPTMAESKATAEELDAFLRGAVTAMS